MIFIQPLTAIFIAMSSEVDRIWEDDSISRLIIIFQNDLVKCHKLIALLLK